MAREKDITMNLRISQDLKERAEKVAKSQDISLSQMIRVSLEQYMINTQRDVIIDDYIKRNEDSRESDILRAVNDFIFDIATIGTKKYEDRTGSKISV